MVPETFFYLYSLPGANPLFSAITVYVPTQTLVKAADKKTIA
jgi:hypothetical protein